MEIDTHVYNEGKLTTWASPTAESLLAIAAKQIAQERMWDAEKVCRALNHLILSGGRSGVLRNPEALTISTRIVRDYVEGQMGRMIPEVLKHFTPTPMQMKILQGE